MAGAASPTPPPPTLPVFWLSAVVSTLSVCGSLFIVSCYIGFPHLRKFAFKLVLILSCMDLAVRACCRVAGVLSLSRAADTPSVTAASTHVRSC